MPKVSVVIPTHNRSDLLQSAISSVVRQTYKEWEAITIDDHSTDQTRSVVEGFSDSRVKYIQNSGKSGPSVARNKGIEIASGEFIAFLDDDDEWTPFKLEKQIDIMDSCGEKFCGIYSNRLMINKLTGETYSEDPGADTLRGNLLMQLMIKNPIHTSTLMIRKSCLDKIGLFDENMRYMEDRDLFIRLAMNWDYEYIDEPLVKAYYHGKEHLSRNLAGQTHGREIILHRYKHLFRKNRISWGKMYVCLGTQYCQLGNMKKGRENLLKGIWLNPLNKIAIFHFLCSFFGAEFYQRIRANYKSSSIY